jgi:hypothetical protein
MVSICPLLLFFLPSTHSIDRYPKCPSNDPLVRDGDPPMQSVSSPVLVLVPNSPIDTVTPARPGVYGQQQQPQPQQQQRPVTFAPNVTPVTFIDTDDLLPLSNPTASSPTATLFPPSEEPAPAPTRKRCPPGKRRSQGYIPRPPNAFMLFRADFVRQKHVPGSIETNHGSLSKIIGAFFALCGFHFYRI